MEDLNILKFVNEYKEAENKDKIFEQLDIKSYISVIVKKATIDAIIKNFLEFDTIYLFISYAPNFVLFNSTPKANIAKSYFVGSFGENSCNLLVSSITALKSLLFRFNNPIFLETLAT